MGGEKGQDRVKQNFVGIRIPDDLYDGVRDYARKNCKGNVSLAVRELLSRGLDPDSYVTGRNRELDEMFQGYLERLDERADRMEEGVRRATEETEERIAASYSKGARAAVATQWMCARFLPAIAATARSAEVNAGEAVRLNRGSRGHSDVGGRVLRGGMAKFVCAAPQALYRYSGKVGGFLLRRGKADILEAEVASGEISGDGALPGAFLRSLDPND